MAERTSDLAIFNLERTITDCVYKDALLDISAIGNGPEIDVMDIPEGVIGQRQMFMRWVDMGGAYYLDDVLNRTVELAESRIASWGKIIMQQQVSVGREVALFSSGIAHEIVMAYSAGISRSVPDVDIKLRLGRRFLKKNGVPIGDTKPFDKMVAAQTLLKAGCEISFIADSFEMAEPFMQNAPNRVYSNHASKSRKHQFDRVYWWKSDPHLVRIIKANHTAPEHTHDQDGIIEANTIFDLTKPNERDEFVTIFTRDDLEFVGQSSS